MKEYIEVKNERIRCNSHGSSGFETVVDGKRYRIPLLPFQFGRKLPDYIPCVKYTLHNGETIIRQNRYSMLKQEYAESGIEAFTVCDIAEDASGINMDILVSDPLCNLFHRMYISKKEFNYQVGDKIRCEYKIMHDETNDGVLVLYKMPEQPIRPEYQSPWLFVNSFKNGYVRHYYVTCQQIKDTECIKKIAEQQSSSSNLWLLTFASLLRNLQKKKIEEKKTDELESVTRAYLELEQRIRTLDDVMMPFTRDKRMNILRKTDSEIEICRGILHALEILRNNKTGMYLSELSRSYRKNSFHELMDFHAVVTIMNMYPETLNDNAIPFAWLTYYCSAVDNNLPIVSCMRGILDNHIRNRVLVVNKTIYFEDEQPTIEELSNLIRLLGIQLLISANLKAEKLHNINHAQICRLLSYLYHKDKGDKMNMELAEKLGRKSIKLLYCYPGYTLTNEDFESESLDALCDKICNSEEIAANKIKVYEDYGKVIFKSSGIAVLPINLTNHHMDVNDHIRIYNILYGDITLCSQQYKGLDGFNDGNINRSSSSWALLYMKRNLQGTKQVDCENRLQGNKVLSYTGYRESKGRQIFYFAGKEQESGMYYRCMLDTEHIFAVPGCKLDNLFKAADLLPLNVTARTKGDYYLAEMKNIIQSTQTEGIKVGDEFIIQAFVDKFRNITLFGENGVLCKQEQAQDKVIDGNYYRVRVLSVPEDKSEKILVEVGAVSKTKFNAVLVNQKLVSDYLQSTRQEWQPKKNNYEPCVRIYVSELIFSIDQLSNFCTTEQKRHTYYQFAKLISCIERAKMSYLYEWLIRMMIAKANNKPLKLSDIPEDVLKRFPRLKNEWKKIDGRRNFD